MLDAFVRKKKEAENQWSSIHLQKLGKERPVEQKESGKKKVIKIREFNEIANK